MLTKHKVYQDAAFGNTNRTKFYKLIDLKAISDNLVIIKLESYCQVLPIPNATYVITSTIDNVDVNKSNSGELGQQNHNYVYVDPRSTGSERSLDFGPVEKSVLINHECAYVTNHPQGEQYHCVRSIS